MFSLATLVYINECKAQSNCKRFVDDVKKWNRYSAATFKFYWAVHPIHGRTWVKWTFSLFRFECSQNYRRKVGDRCLSQTRTCTDKYLSYDSHHPVSHKRSVAKTLLQRAESLPSNSDSQANERKCVLKVLGENDYPKSFLNDCLRPAVCKNQIAPRVIPLLRVMQ
jgi:hypothetical protein